MLANHHEDEDVNVGQGGASLDAQALDVDLDNDGAPLSHALAHPSVVPPDALGPNQDPPEETGD